MRQLLSNLIDNAIKFTVDGGVVVAAEPTGESGTAIEVRFRVSDTGVGIPSQLLESVFQPFEQVDGSVSRRHGGTGLGLAICRKLALLMNGAITVASQPGQGSVFTCTAKFDLPAGVEPVGNGGPFPRGSMIAVVDGDPARQQKLMSRIERLGYHAVPFGALNALLRFVGEWSGENLPAAMIAAVEDLDPLTLDRIDRDLPTVVVGRASGGSLGERTRLTQVADLLDDGSLLAALEVVAQPSPGPERSGVVTGARQGPLRILIVDDMPQIRELIASMIESRGHQALFAANGYEAVASYRAHSPDVVLMDIQMPHMGGIEATAAIRRIELELEVDRRTPIIAVTAHAVKGDRERLLAGGLDDYVSKPIRLEQLFEAIEQATRRPTTPSDSARTP